MFRRTLTTAAAAAALVLVPTAAFGYGADDYSDTGSVSDTTPTVGQAVTVTVQGPANSPVTLTITSNPASLPDSAIEIAGTRSLTKTTDAGGNAAFSVTYNAGSASYTIVAIDATSGAVLSTQTVSVGTVAAAAVAADPSGSGLAVTGSDALPIALGAGALLL
ncbi:MAG TPA: peptidase, partial [Cellulomonas sp.]